MSGCPRWGLGGPRQTWASRSGLGEVRALGWGVGGDDRGSHLSRPSWAAAPPGMILVMKMLGSSPTWGLSVPPAMLNPKPELPWGGMGDRQHWGGRGTTPTPHNGAGSTPRPRMGTRDSMLGGPRGVLGG